MLAEQPLPGGLLPGAVVRVGAQTGFPMDDVAVETDTGGLGLVQAKARLGLGTAEDSPLGRAIGQALEQYWNEQLPVSSSASRRVDASRDALVICTDRRAPASVRDDLPAAIRRVSGQPAGMAIGFELTTGQNDALKVLAGHIERHWRPHDGSAPSDEELRSFLRLLRVITVDALDGEPDHSACISTLNSLVPVGQGQAAWNALVAQGHEASERREWRHRDDLMTALVNAGIDVRPGREHRPDIDKLRALTTSNITVLGSSTALPIAGGIHLSRLVAAELEATGLADGNVLIVGDAGSGKTGIAVGLANKRRSSHDVVLLQAGDIVGGTLGGGLAHPLDQILGAWRGTAPATLIIDGLDAVRGTRDRARLADLVRAVAGTRWQVVATMRTFDVLYSRSLQSAFAGQPVATRPQQVDPRMGQVRHLLVADLTDEELAPALRKSSELAGLLGTATAELARLLHNPFNLRLAVELVAGAVPLTREERGRLSDARTRLDLLDAYWRYRVDTEDMTARAQLLRRVCERMLATRDLRVVEQPPAVLGTDSAAVSDLLSGNVLALDRQGITGAARILVFAHNILFDYATAQYVLLDPLNPSQLINRLFDDPSIPLIARPSLELVIDRLWNQADRGPFWRLALELAGSEHLLASLAVAGGVLTHTPTATDLQPISDVLTAGSTEDHAAARSLTSQIGGALRAPLVPDQVASAAVPGIAWLAATLARSAATNGSWDDAALAVDLLESLERRAPLRPSDPGAADRATTVAVLLDACRAEPNRFEQIAGAVTRHLPSAITTEPTVARAVARLLSDSAAMRQWGGTVLFNLARAVPALLAVDPALARQTATAIWTFDEQRDEQVSFVSAPLLPMIESRRQQAQHAIYELAIVFPRICEADLVSATQIFAEIANTGLYLTPTSDPRNNWPITDGDRNGWLQYGRDLDMLDPHQTVDKMARALRDELASHGAAGTEPGPALAHLTAELHNAAAWSVLLETGSNPVDMARAILPALASGSLLAHPDTHESAARLLAALAETHDGDLDPILEQAVAAAGDRAAANDMPEQILDELLGCLNTSTVRSPQLRSRLQQLARSGPPSITPRRGWSRVGARDPFLDELGADVPAEVATAASALSMELTSVQNRPNDAEEESRLPELFLSADAAIAKHGVEHDQLAMLLVRSASTLADDERVLPGSDVGERVVAVLLEASRSDNAGRFLR
jgi:hypothetical protein